MSLQPIEIAPQVFWVGVLDPQIRVFDLVMKAEHGTTYNAYLIKGESGIALVDTVKESFQDDFLSKLASVVRLQDINYVVLNHLEADHAGAVPRLLEHTPNAQVVITRAARNMLRNFLHRDVAVKEVGDGDTIDLGGRDLRFIPAPFLHWPETMLTYLPQARLLMPCDFLSCHYCDDRMFDDRVGDFSSEYKYYFDAIIRPFKDYALKALDKIQDLEIDAIAPSHGPILRRNPRTYLESYRKWAQEPGEDRASLLVFYASSYGNTARMANAIAQGAREAGANVSVFDLTVMDVPAVMRQVEAARGLAIGSLTFHGDAPKPVWDFLTALGALRMRGKVGAAFGSYGWSGEAPRFIEERLKGLRFTVPEPALRVNMTPSEEDLGQCQEYGRKLGRAVLGSGTPGL